ncbi:hypothetical protein YC2023_061367 [Brassica napus]
MRSDLISLVFSVSENPYLCNRYDLPCFMSLFLIFNLSKEVSSCDKVADWYQGMLKSSFTWLSFGKNWY